jgi:hypothetical protein
MLTRQFDTGNIAVRVMMALACEHIKPGRLYFAIGLGAFVAVDKQVFAIAIEKIENPPAFYIVGVIPDDFQALFILQRLARSLAELGSWLSIWISNRLPD